MFFCEKCQNTGGTEPGGDLDCTAPGCDAAVKRAEFNKWLLQMGWPDGRMKEWQIYRQAQRDAQEEVDSLQSRLELADMRINALVREKWQAEFRLFDATDQKAAEAPSAPAEQAQADGELPQDIEEALDLAYPIPDSPHASVMNRAFNNRSVFERGWQAALAQRAVSGEAKPAEKVHDADADLRRVYDVFQIGKDARNIGVLLTNIRNCMHFFDLLTAVEREFFMVPGEPDEDFPDEEPSEECLVNSWGSTQQQYIEQFRAALVRIAAPSAMQPERLQNWVDLIHDNERSMGDRLQSLSSLFGGMLAGDAVDKFPLAVIREQQPDSERDAALTDAVRDVLAERKRQIDQEGMENRYDDKYRFDELRRAAAVYAYPSVMERDSTIWPWATSWLKHTGPRRDAVKAAALLIAEIERLDRATPETREG